MRASARPPESIRLTDRSAPICPGWEHRTSEPRRLRFRVSVSSCHVHPGASYSNRTGIAAALREPRRMRRLKSAACDEMSSRRDRSKLVRYSVLKASRPVSCIHSRAKSVIAAVVGSLKSLQLRRSANSSIRSQQAEMKCSRQKSLVPSEAAEDFRQAAKLQDTLMSGSIRTEGEDAKKPTTLAPGLEGGDRDSRFCEACQNCFFSRRPGVLRDF